MKLIIYTTLLTACLFVSQSFAQNNMTSSTQTKKPIICNQKYVICTDAPCRQIPGTKNKAMCSCEVEEGASYGFSSCDARKQTIGKKGAVELISTFSFAQFRDHKVMTCPAGTAWTDCLDKKCIVDDPTEPNKANCTCNIIRSNTYVTLGGQCDTKSCSTTLWSGATPSQYQKGKNILTKFLKLDNSPAQYCPKLDTSNIAKE